MERELHRVPKYYCIWLYFEKIKVKIHFQCVCVKTKDNVF